MKQTITTNFLWESSVLQEYENGVVNLTLNRPKHYNALSEAMLDTLHGHLESIAENEALRIFILQGAGKVICTGHDLKEMIVIRKKTYYQTFFKKCSIMMMTLNQMPQPVIARIYGIARD